MLLPDGAPQSAVDDLNRHLGLREPLARPVRPLPPERVPRRLRPVVPVPGTGSLGWSSSGCPPLAAHARGHDPHRLLRRDDRHPRRRPSGHRLRLRAAPLLAVLGQSLPNFWLGIMLILLFGGGAPVAADLRFRGLAAPHPARHHPGRLPDRARRAADALEHARDPEPDFIRTGRRQGPGRAPRRAAPRPPERRRSRCSP